LNRLSSDHGLHNESSVILLDDDHVAIELPIPVWERPGRHSRTGTPSGFPEASEQWGVKRDPSDLRGEDSTSIGFAAIACAATYQQLTLQFFARLEEESHLKTYFLD